MFMYVGNAWTCLMHSDCEGCRVWIQCPYIKNEYRTNMKKKSNVLFCLHLIYVFEWDGCRHFVHLINTGHNDQLLECQTCTGVKVCVKCLQPKPTGSTREPAMGKNGAGWLCATLQ